MTNNAKHTEKYPKLFVQYLPLLLLIIFLIALTPRIISYYEAFFIDRQANINATITNYDKITFLISEEVCKEEVASEYVYFNILRPEFGKYSVSSSSSYLPIKFAFIGGDVSIEKHDLQGNIERENFDTDNNEYQVAFEAKYFNWIFENNESALLSNQVCAPWIAFSKPYGYNSIDLPLGRYINFQTIEGFYDTNQITRIVLTDVLFEEKKYDKITIIFKNLFKSQSHITASFKGEYIKIELPSGQKVGYDDTSSTDIFLGVAKKIIIDNPQGKVTIEREGSTNLLSSPENFFINELGNSPQTLIAETIGSENLSLTGKTNGEHFAWGQASKVTYLGRQLIHTKWESLSSEVQAVIITSLLAILGYVFTNWGRAYYTQYLKMVDRVFQQTQIKNKVEIKPPQGYLVLVLLSNTSIAGIALNYPNFLNNYYSLKDVYLNKGDTWIKGPSHINIKADKIAYSYIQD